MYCAKITGFLGQFERLNNETKAMKRPVCIRKMHFQEDHDAP